MKTYLYYTATVLAVALVIGCSDDNESGNNSSDDAGVNATTSDAGGLPRDGDTNATTSDMDGSPVDLGPGPLRCESVWPVTRTIERTDSAAMATFATYCANVAPDRLAGARAVVSFGSETTEADVVPTQADGGAFVTFEVELPAGAAASRDVDVSGVTLETNEGDLSLGASGPRTHLSAQAVDALVDVPSIPISNPLFSDSSRAWSDPNRTGVLLELGNGPMPESTAFSAYFDSGAAEIVAFSASFATSAVNQMGAVPVAGSDRLSVVGARRPDGGANIFILSACGDANCGTERLRLMYASVGADGQTQSFDTFLHDQVDANPPHDPDAIWFDVTEDGLTALWVTADPNTSTNHLVVATAEATASPGTTEVMVTKADSTVLEDVADKIVAGTATAGLIRDWRSPTDGPATALEGWASTEAAAGGTTFVRFALSGGRAFERDDPVAFGDVTPGTGDMQLLNWFGARARLFTGTNGENQLVAYVTNVFSPGRNGLTAPLDLPEIPWHPRAARVNIASNENGSRFALIGLRGDPSAHRNATALLDGLGAVVFQAGGTLRPGFPIPPVGGWSFHHSRQTTGNTFVAGPGGVATAESFTPMDCCSLETASTRDASLYFDGAGARATLAIADGSQLELTTPTANTRFNIVRRASLFDFVSSGGSVENAMFIPTIFADGTESLIMFQSENGRTQASSSERVDLSRNGQSVDTAAVLSFSAASDGARSGVFVTSELDIVFAASDEQTPAQFTEEGRIETSLNADGSFSGGHACPIGLPGCAVSAGSAPEVAAANGQWSRRIELEGSTVERTSINVPDTALSIAAVMRIASGNPGICPLETVIHVGGADGEVVRLPEATSEDCADLPIPIAVGHFTNASTEQFLVARATDAGATLSLFWLETSQNGASVGSTGIGEFPVIIDVERSDAGGSITVADVNEDGLDDLFLNRRAGASSTPGPIALSDGSASLIGGTAISISGLDVVGIAGSNNRPGAAARALVVEQNGEPSMRPIGVRSGITRGWEQEWR